jgi:4-oxalocrotonate tautomerase
MWNPSGSHLKEDPMPLVDIHVIRGVFTPEQKSEMITKVTDAMVSVEGEKLRGVTWVKINEVEGGDWAIGGQPLQAADVIAMAAD